ncbi:MAG: LLM class flavin-dependent oxidoreductase [Gemmatimonadota bacterium]
MEIGLYTFAEVPPGAGAGMGRLAGQRLRDLIEEIELADQVGLDVYGVGEHHRADYAVSSPAVVLAAGAARSSGIRLCSAVSVLSSDDPVRVFQDFATLDLISNGRAEIMAGRGSFIESFPLFGQDLDDYDDLFAEKLDLLLKLRETETVTWSGNHRPRIEARGVYPRPLQNPLPVWIAVGGTPASVIRAGTLGLPLSLAIIGGSPERFVPLIDLYREAIERGGHPPSAAVVGISSHGFIADTTAAAIQAFYEPWAEVMTRIGRERGWPPTTRSQFDAMRSQRGSLILGSVQEVVDKLLLEHELFANDRALLQITVGSMPHSTVMRSIELLGREVAPVVRKATARSPD